MARRSSRGCVISTLICPDCGMEIPIPRNHGRLRDENHIKDLYCPKCNAVKKCNEVTYKTAYKNLDGQIVYDFKKKEPEEADEEDKYDLNKELTKMVRKIINM